MTLINADSIFSFMFCIANNKSFCYLLFLCFYLTLNFFFTHAFFNFA